MTCNMRLNVQSFGSFRCATLRKGTMYDEKRHLYDNKPSTDWFRVRLNKIKTRMISCTGKQLICIVSLVPHKSVGDLRTLMSDGEGYCRSNHQLLQPIFYTDYFQSKPFSSRFDFVDLFLVLIVYPRSTQQLTSFVMLPGVFFPVGCTMYDKWSRIPNFDSRQDWCW